MVHHLSHSARKSETGLCLLCCDAYQGPAEKEPSSGRIGFFVEHSPAWRLRVPKKWTLMFATSWFIVAMAALRLQSSE